MAKSNATSAAHATSLERQRQCLELRRMGLSYPEIAARVGMGKSQAHALVKAALEETRKSITTNAEDLKSEEVSRLDAMLGGLWADARKGHLGAVDRVLRIMERRAKLLGLDAPSALNVSGSDALTLIWPTTTLRQEPTNGNGNGSGHDPANRIASADTGAGNGSR